MPTSHRRRFHRDRIVRKRQAQYRCEAAAWYHFNFDPESPWWLPDGQLENTQAYFACGRAHCGICHGEKHNPGQRRARDQRAWRRDEAAGWGRLGGL